MKQKILEALDCVLEDVGEDRLVDILVDAYNAQKERLEASVTENNAERQHMHDERERMKQEHHRMRTDPLYCAAGAFFFVDGDGRTFIVQIKGFKIEMCERRGTIDYAAQQISREEFSQIVPKER